MIMKLGWSTAIYIPRDNLMSLRIIPIPTLSIYPKMRINVQYTILETYSGYY